MDHCLIPVSPLPHGHGMFIFNPQPTPKFLRWAPPFPAGYHAVNCDGSFRASDNTAGYGIVIRDSFGHLIVAKTKHFHKADLSCGDEINYGILVLMTEMTAIRDGLRLARSLHLWNTEIQSDSKSAISVILEHSKCPNACFQVLSEIRSETAFFRGLRFLFVYRECNRAADFLSKFLTRDGEKCFDSSDLPHKLQKIVIEDALGFVTPRY